MKKAVIASLIVLVIMFSQIGSAFAETPFNKVVNDLKGISYAYGGTTEKGFDCSGFTMYVFAQFGVDLPHQSKAQAQRGIKVAKDDLRTGDLVFFNTGGDGISHVGIYLGNGQFIHSASKNKKGVTVSSLNDSYYDDRYVTARRIFSDETFKLLTTDQNN